MPAFGDEVRAERPDQMAPTPTLEHRWRLFLGLIALTTLVPYAVMPAAVWFGKDVYGLLLASTLINFLGSNAHVSATAFFYSDPEMRTHFREHKVRYWYVPAALIAGVAAAYLLLPASLSHYIIFYHAMWQTWHYQRQNVGVLSFFAAATDKLPVSRLERLSLELAAVAGMLALLKTYGLTRGTVLEPLTGLIFQSANVVYLLVPCILAAALFREPRLMRNPLRVLGLIMFSGFFLPGIVFNDPAAATLGYALAHGLQYFVFMYFVGISKPRPVRALLTIGVLAVTGGFVLTSMIDAFEQGTPIGRLLFGAAVGTVMSHFVIDAGVWKLRQKFQRGYVRRAFPFVFERG
jgi:hypothetical protein